MVSHGRALVLRHPDPKKKFEVQAYFLTTIGKQLIRLGTFEAHEEYIRAVAEEFKILGASVTIANCRPASGGLVQIFDEKRL